MAQFGIRRRGGGRTSARWPGLRRRRLDVEELGEGARLVAARIPSEGRGELTPHVSNLLD
jgi:hypothetical protein